MTSDAVRFQIMSQVTEDLTGLWELVGTAQSPGLDTLIPVLSALIQERLIAVYRGTQFSSEETVLTAPVAQREIRDKRFWDWSAPEHGPHLRVFATPKGRDWYFAKRKDLAHTRVAS